MAGAAHQMIFSKTHIKEVPMLMSTMRAKEFCSCYFILHKGKDYCLTAIKKGYPLFDYTIDDEKKIVTFKSLLGINFHFIKFFVIHFFKFYYSAGKR